MNYQVVPMDRSHVGRIAALEAQCFSHPWKEQMLEEELFNPQASFLVAEGRDGEVLGYAGLHVILDEGYITNIAVDEQYRRQGVAGALLDVFCRFGAAHLAFLTLEVRASNAPAIFLYKSRKFQKAGRRKDYYDLPREDAILMSLEFSREGAPHETAGID